MNLKLLKPPKLVLLAHLMQWFNGNDPANQHSLRAKPFGQYDSSDPSVIERQINLAQGLGIDVFMVDWYGLQDQRGCKAFEELLAQCGIAGMRAGICIDKGALTGPDFNVSFANQYKYILDNFATSTWFFKDFVMEFGCARKGVTSWPTGPLPIVHDDVSLGKPFFTWVGLPGGAASLAQLYSNPNCIMGSICWDFNDASPTDPTLSVWGGPVRQMTRYKTAVNWFHTWDNIPASMRYVQIITWNDYEENTAIEPLAELFG